MTLNDLELPKRVFNDFLQFLAEARILRVNYDEVAGD